MGRQSYGSPMCRVWVRLTEHDPGGSDAELRSDQVEAWFHHARDQWSFK